jgi:D-alanyl-lipoteichoic acid acyltransferase DltB (MBOAT superfamily)
VSYVFLFFAGGLTAMLFPVIIAALTFFAARRIDAIDKESAAARKATKNRAERKSLKEAFGKKKRHVLVAALVMSLVILGYFKYLNTILYYAGIAVSFTSLGILLPLGLSFYLFQSLSYLIDVYNQKQDTEPSFIRYLLFVSWFPQMIQGPINRYAALAPQLTAPHAPDAHQMGKGLLRMGLGLVKKVAIANILVDAVNVVFVRAAGPEIAGSLALYGVLVYSIQMYADFSGGIDLVEGASELFGIEMAQNFRQPYFSTSLAEFWRRWHMSLGAWMRDYVFYPLAVTKFCKNMGRRAKEKWGRHIGRTLPACFANVVVFLMVGVWHGAEMHYVVWGLYNGIIVALADLLSPAFDSLAEKLHVNKESAGFHLFAIVRTFLVVCVGRFFDRFDHVADCLAALAHACMPSTYEPLGDSLSAYGAVYASQLGIPVTTLVACVVVFAIDIYYEFGGDARELVLSLRIIPQALVICGFVLLIAFGFSLDTTQGGGGFIYANI